jgi:hypothetical protein
MRLPRGFLEDLAPSITRHDILFLAEICRELNLPFREVKNKILGLGEDIEIEFTNDLSEGMTQCEFWLLNSEVNIYKQCPARQMLGCSGCELHNIYNSIDSTKANCLKKSTLTHCQELEWIYNEQAQEHILYNPVTMKLYTKDLTLIESKLRYDQKMEGYLLVKITPLARYLYKKRIKAQKIETPANSKVSQ